MNILLLSAYHSASHRYWCEGMMAALPQWNWTLKAQPARFFSWRVRGSGMIWALGDDSDFRRPYDLIIATSLSDIIAVKAFCPALAAVPLWVYFHENQFAHPLSGRQNPNNQGGWQFQSIQNALCADHITFNTEFNRSTFLKGCRRLLRKLPERLPGDPVAKIESKSDVLPVPLKPDFAAFHSCPKVRNRIIWNHRWEWDKAPDRFLGALLKLHRRGIDFELAMLGSGGGRNGEYAVEAEELESHIVHWGEAEPQAYRAWIASADIGVSTAIHDFQGLAMLELAQAGATVVVPKRLAYPECLPNATFYNGSAECANTDSRELQATLEQLLTDTQPRNPPAHPPADWDELQPAYKARIEACSRYPLDKEQGTSPPPEDLM